MWYENIQYNKGMPVKALLNGATHIKDHWHYGIEIILVIEGAIAVTVNDRRHRLDSGDMVLINKCANHGVDTITRENRHIVLQINPDFIERYYKGIADTELELCPDIRHRLERGAYSSIVNCTLRMVSEYENKHDAYQLKIISILAEMMGLIIRYCPHVKQQGPIPGENISDIKRLDRIISYVNENYTKNIKIQDIAAKEYLSIYYFSRFIKSNIGMSLQEYIMTKRIDKAKYMVLYSSKTLSEIAEECGFEEYKSFLKQFQNRVGVNPSEYRCESKSCDELETVSYKFSGKQSGTILQDMEDGKGYAYGKWGVPVDWDSLSKTLKMLAY